MWQLNVISWSYLFIAQILRIDTNAYASSNNKFFYRRTTDQISHLDPIGTIHTPSIIYLQNKLLHQNFG